MYNKHSVLFMYMLQHITDLTQDKSNMKLF